MKKQLELAGVERVLMVAGNVVAVAELDAGSAVALVIALDAPAERAAVVAACGNGVGVEPDG